MLFPCSSDCWSRFLRLLLRSISSSCWTRTCLVYGYLQMRGTTWHLPRSSLGSSFVVQLVLCSLARICRSVRERCDEVFL